LLSHVKGCDKQKVGQFAAEIRALRTQTEVRDRLAAHTSFRSVLGLLVALVIAAFVFWSPLQLIRKHHWQLNCQPIQLQRYNNTEGFDLSLLRGLEHLEDLSIDDIDAIVDVSPLRGLKKLRQLTLPSTGLEIEREFPGLNFKTSKN